jgi:hypothetical protein
LRSAKIRFFRTPLIAVKFVQPCAHRDQFCSVGFRRRRPHPCRHGARRARPDVDHRIFLRRDVMKASVKLALTGAVATLLWALPISIEFVRPHADEGGTRLGIGLRVDDAQARVGRPATPASVAGVARRTTRRAVVAPVVAAPVAAGAVAAGTAAVVAPAAASCTTVVVRGRAVRRCGRVY